MESIFKLIDEYRSLDLHSVIDYDKFNAFAIVHHSTVIEGATLTENETRLLLEEGITPKGKPLEHSLMVRDHYNALLFVLAEAKNKAPLTIEFIKQVNGQVMKSTGAVYNTALGQVDASRGEFRKGNVSAGGSYFVNYDKVAAYTGRLADSLANRLKENLSERERLELSFAAHFDLVSIHPFYDGNGRTSRLLMNYLQAIFNLPLAIVYKEDKNEYFVALQEARKQESLEPFYGFMYEQYKKYLTTEIGTYKQAMRDKPHSNKSSGLSMFF